MTRVDQLLLGDDVPHILVVDDDERLRSLLKKFLRDHGFRVSTAGDAAEARKKLAQMSFDLMVLDVMMPGETGIDLTLSLRQTSVIPILLLTALNEVDDRISGLESGADDYLPKPFDPKELVLRIQSILRRANTQPAPAKEASFGAFRFDTERGELTENGRLVRLTSGEMALMRVFARNSGQVISRTSLAEQTGAGQERTVDVQVTRLRRKIEQNPREPKYLQTIRGEGYCFWLDRDSD